MGIPNPYKHEPKGIQKDDLWGFKAFLALSQEGVTQLEQSALSEAGDSPTSVSSHRARERTASAHAASTAMVQAVATGEEVEFFQEHGSTVGYGALRVKKSEEDPNGSKSCLGYVKT